MAYENNIYSVKVSLSVLTVEEPGYGEIPFTQSVVTPTLQYRVVSAYEYGGPEGVGVWATPGVCQVPPLGICQNSPRLYWNYDPNIQAYTSVNSEEAEVVCVGITKAIVGYDTRNMNQNDDVGTVSAGAKIRLAYNEGNYNEMGLVTYVLDNSAYDYRVIGVALQNGEIGDIIPVALNCI